MNDGFRGRRWIHLWIIACGVLLFPTARAAVGNVEAIAAPLHSVYLRWVDLSQEEAGVRIERRGAEGDFSELATLPPNTSVYTDTQLEPDTLYFYRIQGLVDGTSPALNVSVRTWPEWQQPPSDVRLASLTDGQAEWLVEGVGATVEAEASADLEGWFAVAPAAFLAHGEVLRIVRPLVDAAFVRALTRGYEHAPAIGLSIPFEVPPEPDGERLDVTLFGASPSELGSTNDDAIGIRVALSVAEPGDVVHIPAGTYTIRQELQMPSGVTLRGDGMDSTVLQTEGIARAVFVPPAAHDIRLENFAITYLGDAEELEHGVYVGSSRQGTNSHRVVVDGLRISRFSVHGVSLRDCHHVLVQNCQILDATNLGGGGHGYGIALNYPTNHNNWIRQNIIGPGIRHAVLLQYFAHNNLVESNIAEANSEDAFDLHGEDEYANELRLNMARNGARDGFGVGNTGSTHDRSGPNNWIHHNTVENSLAGIEVIQGSDVVYIDENTFRGNEYGVRVHNLGGNHLYLRGNVIQNNGTGILLNSARWVWLLDNRIEGSTAYGLDALTDTGDLILVDNVFLNNATDIRDE